jgi:hypothetical protein
VKADRASDGLGHTHRLPGWLVGGVAVSLAGLLIGIVLISVQTIGTNDRLTNLEQYVAGRGQLRDAENARQDQRINDAVCAVLDQLPTGGRLDTVRVQYRCGPGIPAPPP